MDQNTMILIGIALIFIGFFIILLSSISGKESKSWFGIGGFIGPVPFGFANDPKMLKIIIIVTAAFFIIFVLLLMKEFL